MTDPGRLTKILVLDPDTGALMAPVRGTLFRAPLLRAISFQANACVSGAPGIHAFRYGAIAAPAYWRIVLAHCRIPPGTRAVMSPWAVRAERLLIEQLTVHPDVLGMQELYGRLRRMWAAHCDILPTEPSRYVADVGPIGFVLRRRQGRCVLAEASVLWLIRHGQRSVEISADSLYGVSVRRWMGRYGPRHVGQRVIRRVERIMHLYYEHGDAALRDILTPWLRYFDYIR